MKCGSGPHWIIIHTSFMKTTLNHLNAVRKEVHGRPIMQMITVGMAVDSKELKVSTQQELSDIFSSSLSTPSETYRLGTLSLKQFKDMFTLSKRQAFGKIEGINRFS